MAEQLNTKTIFSVRQEITAGNNFDGTEPVLAPTWEDWIFKYAAAAAGGLFRPHELAEYRGSQAMLLVGFEFMGGLQTSWSLSLVDTDGKVQTLYAGTNETSYVATVDSKVVIQSGEELKMVSAGATAGMIVKCKFAPYEV